ncbi:MAG: hypothetical protein GOVbin8609_55 [Prokaryotic dsDNA virus sp.]|nr:MAG: hypothetical protein GOVbin8609_55 [Prokaryotic dsDNA virus sp.]|tara:strand:+ start:17934 stop:18335 length:402 start_codon:yes stop_codon:yes gene_type:complete
MKEITVNITERHYEILNRRFSTIPNLLAQIAECFSDDHLVLFMDKYYEYCPLGSKRVFKEVFDDYNSFCSDCKRLREDDRYPLFKTLNRVQFLKCIKVMGYKVEKSSANKNYVFNIKRKSVLEQEIDDFLEQE